MPEQDQRTKCRLAEILQYNCPVGYDEQGRSRYICYPVPRIFRICQGRPAVEITKLVHIDINTGEVDLSQESSQTLPKAKPWRDIIRTERTTKSA